MQVTICIGSSCHLKGSREIVETLERLIVEHKIQDKVELKGAFCMDRCMKGVCVRIEEEYYSLTPKDTDEFFKKEILGRLLM